MGTRRYEYFERNFKWTMASSCRYDGDMPVLQGCHKIPRCLVPFDKRFRHVWKGAFLHSFQDDFCFDGPTGLWWDTGRHRKIMSEYAGVLSPDYSVYVDAGRIPQMWNIYRSRLVGCQLQAWGLEVIPTVSWGDEKSFDFCFDGLPVQSILAVSTVGVMRDARARLLFEIGFQEMCRRKSPELVVVYGSSDGLDLGGQAVRCYSNSTYDWTHLTTNKESEV